MAEHQSHHQQPHHQQASEGLKNIFPEKTPSSTSILAVVTLLPIGGILLLFAGITLAGTLIGLALATPLFVIFSPVLIPTVLVIGLSVTGFLTSGAFGVTAVSSLSWIANWARSNWGSVPDQLEYGKRRAQETAGQLGQKARESAQETAGYLGQKKKETGQTIQSKAHEGGRAHT